jgi:hypothetical protein
MRFSDLLASLVVAAAVAGPALAEPLPAAIPCPDDPAGQVRTADAGHVDKVCSGIAAARAFLTKQGVDADGMVVVEIHRTVLIEPGGRPVQVLGLFEAPTARIKVAAPQTLARMAGSPGTFREPYSDELFVSVVAHEATHALIDPQMTRKRDRPVAHEYIAYVVQLASLAAATRERILARLDLAGFADASEINPLIYAMSPDAFAIKAWRHHVALDDGGAFIRGLLSGAVRLPPLS